MPSWNTVRMWNVRQIFIFEFSEERLSAVVNRLSSKSNSWIVLNVGGGPTDDKLTVTLQTPRNPNEASNFMIIRVADIWSSYKEWQSRGAEFITQPKDHGIEIRCYVRDPDGYLIEIGQTTGRLKDIKMD